MHKVDRKLLKIDWLLAGPSCKDVSRLNNSRKGFLQCYEQDSEEAPDAGTSGPTYRFGFRKATLPNIKDVQRFFSVSHIYIYIQQIPVASLAAINIENLHIYI